MIEHHDLRLPAPLAQRFDAWIEAYESLDDAGTAAFNLVGLQLATELRQVCGSGVYVEFVAEAEGGGLGETIPIPQLGVAIGVAIGGTCQGTGFARPDVLSLRRGSRGEKMLPTSRELRDQVRWFVNGRPLGPAEWICTQYVGRDRLYGYDFDSADLVLWEARIPKPVFHEMYRATYDEVVESLRNEPEAAAARDRRSVALRQLGFPPLSRLTGEHFFIVRDEIVEADLDLLELLYMNEPATPAVRGYAVQRIVEVVESSTAIRVFGLAVLSSQPGSPADG